MATAELHVVTGAFGFSGKYIARRLLDAGCRVRTLTNSPHRPDPFDGRVETRPLSFDDPAALAESLSGASVFYNTYWVRFNHRNFTFADTYANTLALFAAAREAGVRRFVHVSITNPSENSPVEYFRWKARLERALAESGLSHAILRPAALFGDEDILINNIAWSLRKFPVFPIFGDGRYRLRPIHADDLAALAVRQGAASDNCTIDAVGPESFAYRDLLQMIGALIGRQRHLVSAPPTLAWLGCAAIGRLLGDVMLTRDEVRGLMLDLLSTDSPPAGPTRLTDWVAAHADSVGLRYRSELARRRDRQAAYQDV